MAHLTRWLSRPQPRTSPRPSLRVEHLEGRDAPAVFSNTNPITINTLSAANPFPSQITVSGMGTSVSNLTVTLNGFNYSQYSYDADLLLVGPQGQKVLLMSDCGAASSNLTITFADGSPSLPDLNTNLSSGTFAPTNRDAGTSDNFPAYGGPAGPYGAALSGFTGTNPNGTWALYIIDEIDTVTGFGSITSGWSLDLSTAPRVSSSIRVGAPTTNATSVDYTVTFDQSVTGVDASDFTLTTSGLSGTSVTNVSGSGSTYTVTVNTGSGDGTLRLDVTDDDTIVNGVPESLGGTGAGNGNFTTGQVYTIDKTAPTVASHTWPANATYIAGQNLDFTITYGEAVTVTGTPRIPLTVGSTGVFANYFSGSGTTSVTFRYTVQAGDLDTDGILVSLLQLNGGTMRDAVGNDANSSFSYPSTAGVRVDAVVPTVTSVAVPANATYIAGQNLTFTINFTEAVTVTGTPQLALTIGSTSVQANYLSGTGSTALVFRYTVLAGDTDTDGITVGALTLNGGTIRDAATNNANLTLNSVGSTAAVLVDTTAPTISSVTGPSNATYIAGQNLDFTVNFSEAVTVNTGGGTPTIQLTIGSTNVNATYVSGSGSTALLFRYTVASGDLDTNGITSASPIVLNGGTIRDAATNNAVLTFTPPTTTGVLVDAVNPTVTSVAVPANGSYRAGQNLTFTVNFTEAVTVTGTPQLALTIGSTTVQANYLSGTGSTALVFRYTVLAGDTDTDGIAVGALTLNGGTIRDAATNNANLTLNSVGSTAAVLVDTTAPAAPVVTAPASTVTVNSASFTVTGTAEANALVEIFSDLNNNGVIDGADAVVSSQQLTGGATNFSILVALTQDAVNNFTVRATDAAGNTSPLADVPTITEDSTAATVTTVTPPANGAYMAGTNLDFVLTYSEAVTVTGAPRIALTVGGASVFATYLTGTGGTALTFRYTVQPGDTDTDGVALGTSIALNGGTIRDAGSNDASVAVPSTPTPNVTVDTTAPTVAMTSATPAATNTNPIPVTVTFSETVTGFDVTDLSATNGTVSNFVAVNGSTYTFLLTPTTDGVVSVDIVSFSAAIDAAGNPAGPAATFTRTYDGTRPTPTVALAAGQAAFTALNTVRFAVNFSEDVTGFDVFDVTVGGTAGGGSVSVTGSGSSYIVTVSGMTQNGTVNVTIANAAGTDAVGNTSVTSGVSADVTYRTVPTIIPVSTPGGAGGTQIQIFDPETDTVIRTVTPFPGYGGAIDMASADVNGDGVDDFIVGAGAGGAPHVRVIDGATGAPIAGPLGSFFAFTTAFTGGVDVAAGDVTGDGVPDIVVGAGPNAAAHVKVFDGVTGAEVRSFFAYNLAYRYGVNVAVGDTNGDGFADIVTAPTMFGAPHVQVFSGFDNALLQSFFAYNVAFTGGVTVAVGDTNGDGFADIITGTGLGGVPHVKVFNGNSGTERASFFAYTTLFAGGVDVAAADVNGDGLADIVTGAGPGAGPHVKAFDGNTFAEIESFFAANLGFLGGVNVG